MMLERGFVVAATRIFKRVWQLYAAYVVLFAIYIVTIGDVAARYAAPDIIYEFNVAGLVDHPIRTVGHGLLLQSRALNLDVLQLYIVLMALSPAGVVDHVTPAGAGDVGIDCALCCRARQFDWNFPSFPDGNLVFQPVLLAAAVRVWRLARARRDKDDGTRCSDFPILRYLGIAYLGLRSR